jgi:RNA-directed DNA polymerase
MDQDWRVRMVAARMEDGARRRLIQQGLKAGGLDTEGQGLHPATGTPPGGTVAPLLATVVLPSVLALGVETGVKQPCRGEACLIRYADEVVGAVDGPAQAERFDNVLGHRREQVGLARAAAKTRLSPCSRDRAAGRTRFELRGFAC